MVFRGVETGIRTLAYGDVETKDVTGVLVTGSRLDSVMM